MSGHVLKTTLWVLLAMLVAAYCATPLSDPDLWWHIVVGRWILAEGALPTCDHWNLFAAQKPWVAYSWLAEVSFALAENTFGIWGLVGLKLLFACMLSFAAFICLSRLCGDFFFGAVLGTAAVAACSYHFGLRPQSLSWMLFFIVIVLAEEIRRRGMRPRLLLGLYIAFVLWANTNVTAVIGMFVLLCWLWGGSARQPGFRVPILAGLVSLAGTLSTPYLGGVWLTFFEKADHPFKNLFIGEFQPATLYHATANIALLLFVLMLVFAHASPRTLSLKLLVLNGAVLFGAFVVQKFVPFAAVLLSSSIACQWYRERGERSRLGNVAIGVEKGRGAIEGLGAVLLSAACLVLLLGIAHNLGKTLRMPVDATRVAVHALDFIEEKKLAAPIATIFDDGGYVLYRFSDRNGKPKYRVVLDGRTNVNDPLIQEKHDRALRGDRRWHEYLEATGAKTVLWRQGFSLPAILEASGLWCEVYADPPAERPGWVVFVPCDNGTTSSVS